MMYNKYMNIFSKKVILLSISLMALLFSFVMKKDSDVLGKSFSLLKPSIANADQITSGSCAGSVDPGSSGSGSAGGGGGGSCCGGE